MSPKPPLKNAGFMGLMMLFATVAIIIILMSRSEMFKAQNNSGAKIHPEVIDRATNAKNLIERKY